MSERGAVPEEELPDSISGVVSMFGHRVADLERAFTSIHGTLQGVASTMLAIDKKLDGHMLVSETTRREVDAIRLERAKEAGETQAVRDIRNTWVAPWLSKGLMALVFAGFVAFIASMRAAPTAPVAVPTAADIAAAVAAALKHQPTAAP